MSGQEAGAARLDPKTAEELERRYDAEMRFRTLRGFAARLVPAMLVALSVFHYYTAGFGILPEHWHKAIHLSAVLGLIFLMFPAGPRIPGPEIGGVPWYDWLLAAIMVVVCLYLPLVFDELTFRIGSPNTTDVVMGTLMLILTLETCRRSMGWALPIVVLVSVAYGLWGNHLSGVLAHPGADWEGFISHIYLTQEGIFGIPVMVVATYVFHFVLFGVLATRMGLGQFFIDMASIAAGRFAGGPAKVSVFGSALFG
ncbi:MAG TPA: TRAP transporter large permease subunit, partial [Acetobacteraceae bacterium]|nr:TRAP transporter large permease subunit [Acetobacteraceae bacterium]